MIDASRKGFGFGLGAATGAIVAQAHGVEIATATRAVTGTAATLAISAGKVAIAAGSALVATNPGIAMVGAALTATAVTVEVVERVVAEGRERKDRLCTIL